MYLAGSARTGDSEAMKTQFMRITAMMNPSNSELIINFWSDVKGLMLIDADIFFAAFVLLATAEVVAIALF